MVKQRRRVLIMMSETGGGHKASAEALRQAFQELYGDKVRGARRGTDIDGKSFL